MAILYTLLLVGSLLASSIMLFGELGIYVTLLVGLLSLLLYCIRSIALAMFCYVLILLLILFAMVLSTVSCDHERARNLQCLNNMKQIALALCNYEQHYNCFPPPSFSSDDGKPMHSWRVLILPFMEQDELYKEYDFNEPWDGPKNRRLLEKRPCWGYACPSDTNTSYEDESLINYAAFIGPNTIWSGKRSGSYTIDSVMLVETLGSDIQWTEPRDVVAPDKNASEPETPQPTIASRHTISPGLFWHDIPATNVAFHDGSVRSLPTALFTDNNISNSINVDDESVARWIAEHRRVHWPHTIGLTVWIVSLVLLIHWSVRCKNTAQRQTAENAETNADADRGGED